MTTVRRHEEDRCGPNGARPGIRRAGDRFAAGWCAGGWLPGSQRERIRPSGAHDLYWSLLARRLTPSCLLVAVSLSSACAERASEGGLGGAAQDAEAPLADGGSSPSEQTSSGAGGSTKASSWDPTSLLFDGTGVELQLPGQKPNRQVEGAFFILEDSIFEGMPAIDGLSHTDFRASTGADETAAPFSAFTQASQAPCIKGTLAAVTFPDGRACGEADTCAWSELWGGGLGLEVHAAGELDAPWNAQGGGVHGFEFETTGSLGGATLRFKVKDHTHPGEDFCTLVGMGKRRVEFSELNHQCWTEGTIPLDPASLVELQWQLIPDVRSLHEISEFCLVRLSTF